MKVIATLAFALMLSAAAIGQTAASGLPPGDSPPPSVFDRIARAGDADAFDSAAYAIVIDSAVTAISKDGVAKTQNYLVRKVLTSEGCRELAVLSWGYEPLSSYVDILEVNVIRDSTSIPVDINSIRDLPAPQSGIYWSNRLKIIQLPRLRVGDGIEIKSFRKGYSYALLDSKTAEPADARYVPPMRGEYFDIELFESTAPIIEKKYVLKMPSEKRIHSQIYNGPMYSSTTYAGDTTTYAWWIKNAPAWEPQDYRADDPDILAKVVIATVESWEAKSRWFFEVNEPQFAFTPAIKAKVDEIFKNAGVTNGTEEQKAFELVHWVAQNIRYSGQTMGEGEGYTLHPGAMIFEQRSGVCKDIAGMLVTMMRAAGMNSYAAMTMAGSRIEKVPADQFNHCVVALRKDDGRFVMYDPTWVPYDKDIWSKYEIEQQYLIGSPEGAGLNQISYSPAEESPLNAANDCRILKDGTLEGTLKLTAEGAMDGRLRGFIYYRRLSETENYLANVFHNLSDRVEIISSEHGDILDFHKAMWWKISYRIPDYAMFVDNGYEFPSPLMRLADKSLFRYISIDWPEKRRDEVFFYNTSFFNGWEVIKLPDGYKVEKLPDKSEISETYASFGGDSQMKKGNLEVSQKIKIKRRQIPSDGYDGFRKAMKEADDYAGTEFRAVKGGAK